MSQDGWTGCSYDAKSAYLQSEGIDRVLLIRMPGQQPPPGTVPHQVLRALGAPFRPVALGGPAILDLVPSSGWLSLR